MAKKFKYELLLTARKDDRFGRAVSTVSLKTDDPDSGRRKSAV
jgi:hypothetical protein